MLGVAAARFVYAFLVFELIDGYEPLSATFFLTIFGATVIGLMTWALRAETLFFIEN